MTAPVFDSVAAIISVEERRIPALRGAFDAAIESGDPGLIFSTGGGLLASLYGLAYNKLGQARRDPSQMEDMVSRICQATEVFLSHE